MKKFSLILALFMVVMFVACNKEETKTQEQTVPQTPQKEEVYQPVHSSTVVDLKTAKKYQYFAAPSNAVANSVSVDYDAKTPYAKPIVVKYAYPNGDTYTYTVPETFGLWTNQAGKFRVVTDKENTVWIQGQEKNGKFHEFVFIGNPQHNGIKIKPNSYTEKIKYRK